MLSPFCITSHMFKQRMPKGGGLAIAISGEGDRGVNPVAPIHFFEAKHPDFAPDFAFACGGVGPYL
ncbi:hypothetical protein DXT97_14305 [Agrobacterium tumefaciens]|jgi:hypothetical protein|nr:hypothetical protein [Agrobacterium tumefaciens]MQB37959.1 hypothetical protein [Agrobacterium tumefaciens]QAA98145.1 hypothetical protein DC439_10930 [Agrobacterium tumefaciens]